MKKRLSKVVALALAMGSIAQRVSRRGQCSERLVLERRIPVPLQ